MRDSPLRQLATLVQDLAPRRCLCIGAEGCRLLAAALPRGCRMTCLPAAAALTQPQKPYDLGVVVDTLPALDREQGARLLAGLRDRFCRQVLVAVPAEPGREEWKLGDFLALGFSRLTIQGEKADGFILYHFNLHDYKTTPDWLNPRFWAHPERWQP